MRIFPFHKKPALTGETIAAALQKSLPEGTVSVHRTEHHTWQIMVELQQGGHDTEALTRVIDSLMNRQFKLFAKDWHVLFSTHRAAPDLPKTAAAKKPSAIELRGVKRIIVVASGKGGVGKSTVAANLAVALAQQGLNVGLLDADIYGPSQPRLMGLQGQKPEAAEDGRIKPLQAHGLSVMSIGFMVDDAQALIWRGPMVQSAFKQLLSDVAWDAYGTLDVLVLDTPPGTGDVQLTLAQSLSIDGAVIVSTPQDLALADARKGVTMFQRLHVPIVGIIENMSVYCCPNCGHQEAIFGEGGVAKEADALGVDYLGGIALHPSIRTASDGGRPFMLDTPDQALTALAAKMAKRFAA